MNLNDLPEEFQALRVPTTEFDAKSFLKKYLAGEGYGYLSEYGQKDYEERKDYQDEKLQQLVLDHLSVFVQCKDAIEDVYNSDKQLFTGAAMSQIVEVFAKFREQMIEPLLQPILTMDTETNSLRNIQSIAVRNAAVLNLPFQALRRALEGDFDDCVQHLKSIVSFLDSSKFQRYSVVRLSRRNRAQNNNANNNNNNGGDNSNNNNNDGNNNNNFNNEAFGTSAYMFDDSASQNSNDSIGTNMTGVSSNDALGGMLSSAANTTLQPFEVAHRLFASWISAAEDTAHFALFLARHELAGSFTLLANAADNSGSSSGSGEQSPLSVSNSHNYSNSAKNRNINNNATNRKDGSSSNNNNTASSDGARGVRMVELEDLFFQIIRLLDVLSMIRLERYRLLGPRAVEVADAARQANCTTTTGMSSANNNTNKNDPSSNNTVNQQKKDNSNDQQQGGSNKTNQLQYTSREIGIAKYLSAVLVTSTKNPLMRRDADKPNSNNDSGKNKDSGNNSNNNNNFGLPTASALLDQSRNFSQIFGDPRAQHPVLVYCHLYERSIHLNVIAAIKKLELEIRSVEVSAEQQLMKETRQQQQQQSQGGGDGGSSEDNLRSVWWGQFVPRKISNIRLVSVAPDHHRLLMHNNNNSNHHQVKPPPAPKNANEDDPSNPFSSKNQSSSSSIPNRTAILAKSLLFLKTEGLSSSSTANASGSSSSSSESIKALSLSSAVLLPFTEPPSHDDQKEKKSSNSDNNNNNNNNSSSPSWLDGKSDEDAVWFANHCEQNLQTFKSVLACLAPPSISSSLAQQQAAAASMGFNNSSSTGGDSSSSTSNKKSNSNNKQSTTKDSSSSFSSKLSSSGKYSSSPFLTRHKSMNVIASHFTMIVRDSLRGVASAWKKVGPLLRPGSALFKKDQMEWMAKAGIVEKDSSSSSRRKQQQQHTSVLAEDFMSLNNNTNNNNAHDEDDDYNQHQQDLLNSIENEPDVDEFLNSAAMLRRLHSTSIMNSFNLSVPSRTIEKLQQVCVGFREDVDSVVVEVPLDATVSESFAGRRSSAGEGFGSNETATTATFDNSKKTSTLLIATSRLEMVNWLRIFGKFANSLFRELILADLQGFFCSLAAFKFSSNAASFSSSSSQTDVQKIETEMAQTIRRWSNIFNNLVRDITEMQRTIALECSLSKTQDPFVQSNIVQTSLLVPLSTSFSEAIRRIFFISHSEVWAPKSASWVLKEMEQHPSVVAASNNNANRVSTKMFSSNAAASSSSASSNNRFASSTAGSSTFAESMETFVAHTRQSIVNRFGDAVDLSSTSSSNNNNNSDLNKLKTADNNKNCTEFTISLVQATSKMLTICAPLLRVVKKFDKTLCNLIAGTIFDHLSTLQQRASHAALISEKTNHAMLLDSECASWLSFLSCAPFSCSHGIRMEVLRAFGGRMNNGGTSMVSNYSSGNTKQGSSSSSSGDNNNSNKISSGGGGGSSNSSDNNNDFLSRTVSKELLGFARCVVLEQSVADSTAILNTAIPVLISENVAATLTFRTTSINDSRSASSATSSWLTNFFLYRKEGKDASTIDSSLAENRQKFLSCLLTTTASTTSSSSESADVFGRGSRKTTYSEILRPQLVRLVSSVYETSRQQIFLLANKAVVSALEVWFSQSVVKTTKNIENAMRYDEKELQAEISLSQYVASSTHGVRTSSVDLFPFIVETLITTLRWVKRCEDYFSEDNSDSNSDENTIVASCWDAVISPVLDWSMHHEQVLLSMSWNGSGVGSSSIEWQKMSFSRFVGQMHHLVDKHFEQQQESTTSLSSSASSSASKRKESWLNTLQSLQSSTASNSSASSSSSPSPPSNITSCCSSYSSLMQHLSQSLDPNIRKQKLQKMQNKKFFIQQQLASSPDAVASRDLLPVETVDNFLSKYSPIEFEAWKKERGLESEIGEQQKKEDLSNKKYLSSLTGGDTNTDAFTESYLANKNKDQQQKHDPWWAADSRGAERREIKLLERRGARVAAATNLLNQNNAHQYGGIRSSASPGAAQQEGLNKSSSDDEDEDQKTDNESQLGFKTKRRRRKRRTQRTSFFSQKADEANKSAVSAISNVINPDSSNNTTTTGRRLFGGGGNNTAVDLGSRLSALAAPNSTRSVSFANKNTSNIINVEPLSAEEQNEPPQPALGSRLQGILASRAPAATAAVVELNNNAAAKDDDANSRPSASLFARKRHRR